MKSKLLLIFLALTLLFNLSLASAAFAKIKVLPNEKLGLTFEKAGTWPFQVDVNFRFKSALGGCGFVFDDTYEYFYYTFVPDNFDTELSACIQGVRDVSENYGPCVANTLKNAFRPLFYEFQVIKFSTPKDLHINNEGYIEKGELIYPVTRKDEPGLVGEIIDRIEPQKIIISGAKINFGKDQSWILLNKEESFIGLQHATSDDYLFIDSSNLKLSYKRNTPPEIDKGKKFNSYLAFYTEDEEGNPVLSKASRTVMFETKDRTKIKKKLGDYCEFEGRFLVDGLRKTNFDICVLRSGLNLENFGDASWSFLDTGTLIKSKNSEIIQPQNQNAAKDLISIPT